MTAGFAIARGAVCVIGTSQKEGDMPVYSLAGSGLKEPKSNQCENCGKPAAKFQVRKGRKVYYCENCLAPQRTIKK